MTFALQARGSASPFGGVEVLHGVDLDAVGGSVLALLGENGAGKSTLVKIIAGDYTPDAGEVIVDGVGYPSLTPIAARDLGVAIIFQEFQDAPTLTVAENISLGRLPNRLGVVDWRGVDRRAAQDPQAARASTSSRSRPCPRCGSGSGRSSRSPGPCRARPGCSSWTSRRPRSRITRPSVLFAFVRRLRDQGVAIIYITHRLDEVTDIADRVQVLRDGNVASSPRWPRRTDAAMIEAMVGRRITEIRVRPSRSAGERRRRDPLDRGGLRRELPGRLGRGPPRRDRGDLRQARLRRRGTRRDGLRAAARDRRHPGDRWQGGQDRRPRRRRRAPASASCPPIARRAGPSWSGRSRRTSPSPSWPAWRRSASSSVDRTEGKAYRRWHDKLSIRSRNDPRQAMGTLSGGNQQKVLLGRWLERKSHVLVLIEPTRGVDVGARQDIYRALASSPPRGSRCSSRRPITRRPCRSPTGSMSCPRAGSSPISPGTRSPRRGCSPQQEVDPR